MSILKYILYCIGCSFDSFTAVETDVKAGSIGALILLILAGGFLISLVLLSRRTEWEMGKCFTVSIFIMGGIILLGCIVCFIVEALV